MKKGATEFDKLCHRIFSAKGDGWDYYSRGSGVHCSLCGQELKAYYCEERLYMVECTRCNMKALAEGRSPKEAALKTFGTEEGTCDE